MEGFKVWGREAVGSRETATPDALTAVCIIPTLPHWWQEPWLQLSTPFLMGRNSPRACAFLVPLLLQSDNGPGPRLSYCQGGGGIVEEIMCRSLVLAVDSAVSNDGKREGHMCIPLLWCLRSSSCSHSPNGLSTLSIWSVEIPDSWDEVQGC